ncbi:unnamed protein product [Victoria cruziana]
MQDSKMIRAKLLLIRRSSGKKRSIQRFH